MLNYLYAWMIHLGFSVVLILVLGDSRTIMFMMDNTARYTSARRIRQTIRLRPRHDVTRYWY